MGISVSSFFKERKFLFVFTLSLLLVCLTILLFTSTSTPYPLFFYSDLQTSQPISPSAPSNPAGAPTQVDDLVWEEPSFPVSGNSNWNLCTGPAAVDYIPCLDNIKAIKALQSRRHMEHRERHCPQPPPRCLEPLPKGYKVPVSWPQSRDMIWYDNVPHPKLVEYKKDQNWVKKSDDHLIFPGGGTQFKEGVDHYTDFIEKTLPVIEWGRHVRVVLDVGCGVASFGGYLLDKNVITMSFAPKDEHEAQIQFALERGIPATLSVIGTQRLTFPNDAFDLIHCARCRVHWDADGGKPLLELNRVLRPGAMEALTKSMCWDVVAKTVDSTGIGLVIYQKPISFARYFKRKENNPPVCGPKERKVGAWYAPLPACLTPLPRYGWPLPWPIRLTGKPPSLNHDPEGEELFYKDTLQWTALVSDAYKKNAAINWSTVRNVMDMNAGFGGFAAALTDQQLWVMNVVPIHLPNTLPVIFDRGLIGIYHDWCESLNTYPRTYDLLHSNFLFEKLPDRCDIVDVVVEMDRVLRPGGYLVVRDTVEVIDKLRPILQSLPWSTALYRDQFLFGKKGLWRPSRGASNS
ncbi:hypothetical protein C1H46_030495 [Malus baccata]|uniref:Methyltransferase n=1 Tax=Malus baccata TaxID=106549 RepID=A0A540LBV3_MALBA|nr:hypothetical protein C1H46_030495 [Malus baccata]